MIIFIRGKRGKAGMRGKADTLMLSQKNFFAERLESSGKLFDKKNWQHSFS